MQLSILAIQPGSFDIKLAFKKGGYTTGQRYSFYTGRYNIGIP